MPHTGNRPKNANDPQISQLGPRNRTIVRTANEWETTHTNSSNASSTQYQGERNGTGTEWTNPNVIEERNNATTYGTQHADSTRAGVKTGWRSKNPPGATLRTIQGLIAVTSFVVMVPPYKTAPGAFAGGGFI